ncbi:MAG: HIT family protein [Patescibacteria group bacterium]
MDCLFCKIINREIPANFVYENDKVVAFLDIAPVNPGHTLVVPKEHCENILDASDETLAELILAVRKIGQAIQEGLGYQGFNLGVNNGRVAGQIVPHLHFHIMPRRVGDGLRLWPQRKYEVGEAEVVAEKIQKAIK